MIERRLTLHGGAVMVLENLQNGKNKTVGSHQDAELSFDFIVSHSQQRWFPKVEDYVARLR